MITRLQIHTNESVPIGHLNLNDFKKFKHTDEVNGKNCLEIIANIYNPYAEYFVKYNRIMFYNTDQNEWLEFIIQRIKTDDEIFIYCENSIYELNSFKDPFLSITGNTVTTGQTEILSKATTNWLVGTTDITGTYSMQRSKHDIKENTYDWARKVGGEVKPRILFSGGAITRYVDTLSSIGEDRGKVVFDDREIRSFSANKPIDDYYTAAYGYGVTDNETQLDFSEVEWSISNGDPIDKPLGQSWVGLADSVKGTFGVYTGSGYQHRTTIYEDTEETDALALLQATYDSLIANIVSKTEYALSIADPKSFGFYTEEIRLGDTVGISITRLGLKFKARVVKYIHDYLDEGNNDFDFNFSRGRITDTLSQTKITATSALNLANRSLTKKTSYEDLLGNLLDQWNAEVNASGANTYSSTDGILSLNAESYETATKGLNIVSGILRIANSKIGGLFDWSTMLTGDGIIADAIYTGVIRGENFDIDLNSGLIQFGKRVDGVIDNPVMQFTLDGFNIPGEEVTSVFTGNGHEYTRTDNGQIVAKFNKDEASAPILRADKEIRMGNFRIFQFDENTIFNTFVR